LTLSTTASSGLVVSFASTTPSVCTVSNGSATFLSGGTCTIQATQPGNTTYAAAIPVSQSFSVNNPTPVILNMSPNFVVAGSAVQTITLAGTGFLPSMTATYAGVAQTITYANYNTVKLALTAADQTEAITLSNPAPGGGTASINLPVLINSPGMLASSQLAAGDQARMQQLIQKGRNGTPVTIAAIGGSTTAGTGASDFAHSYASLFQTWWNQTFPASTSTLVDAGIGNSASDYGSLRAQRDVLSSNPDLVIVEFAVDDQSGGVGTYGDTYEGLVRQFLDAPTHPAVILLFMMKYQFPIVESNLTAESWQSGIGANYDLPMVSYFDAISPALTSGNITLAEVTADGTDPTDMGHAYAALFLEQNLQNAIDIFSSGTALEPIPATQAPLYSSDFEFTSLEDGTGGDGPPLNPSGNQGWGAEPIDSQPAIGNPDSGLLSSTSGSTLDFVVTGKEIMLGYWIIGGPMGQASVTVDGVPAPSVLDGWSDLPNEGRRGMSRVANGLANGPHQVQIELLDTVDSGSTGHNFLLLSVGAGGVQSSITADETVFIGDSITEGWSGTAEFTNHSNWVGKGVSGNTSTQILARFQSDVIDLHPSIVHILAGTNDLNAEWNLCAPGSINTCANIEAMVQAVEANNIIPILGTVPPWGPGELAAEADPDFVARNAKIDALNGWLKEYATQEGITLVDYHSVLCDTTGDAYIHSLSGDGVHPSADGFQIMTTMLLNQPVK
jgi:lysophospholipase L1-like esterase